MSEFPVELTPAALAQVQRLVRKDGRPNVFLRVGVKGGGCSGLEYVLKLDDSVREYDLFSDQGEIKVACDAKSAVYLKGARLDHTSNLIGGGFKFENPNADRSCGCGTSFTPRRPDTA